jgi:integrase
MATIRLLRGRWQAQVRRKGVPPRGKSFDKRSEAVAWARGIEAEADRSGFVADTRLAEQTTLGELLKRYCVEVTPTKKSASSEKSRIGALMRRDLCHRTLAKLTSVHIAGYRDERLQSVAPATVVRELNTISHALDVAQREWGFYLPRNPAKAVRRPSLPRGRQRRLKDGEEARLLEACDEGRNRWLKPLIILALESAMRRGELVGLLWENVDLHKRVAHLPITKNGEARDIPLSQRATATLGALFQDRSDRKRVFPMSGNAVRLAWEHLRDRAGCDGLNFHDLRHEAISRLFERGLGLMEVATISGHKELRMLQRYTHLRAQDLVARLG